MQNLVRVYRLLNILSIDVAAGAVVCALFFAKIFDVSVIPFGLISLGLTVWIIYTADHMLDAYKIQRPASTERHRFHQQHFKKLFVFLIIAMVIDAIQLAFIRKVVLYQGLALAVIVVVYFLAHRYLKFFKEVIGAALYSGGVLLIPWSVNSGIASAYQLLLIAQFAMTALINLFLFSWFGLHQDEKDNHSSYATVMGYSATKYSIAILFFVQFFVSVIQFELGIYFLPVIILLLMNLLLLIIFSQRSFFEIHDRYRLLGDAVFLLPLIYLLV